jgi:hypothetical protein
MGWSLLVVALVGLLAARRVQRERLRRDAELGVPTVQAYRKRGVGHLGQAPTYPHHKLGD